MKKLLFTTILIACTAGSTFAQFGGIDDIKKKAKDGYNKAKEVAKNTTGGGTSSLTNDEIISGLKEALKVGSQNSSSIASKLDGYYKNPSIKIPFPPEAQRIEQTVRSMGMGKQVDKVVLTMNRAAEEAAKEAAPIFMNAITSMTISDGLGILNGANNAATQYLQRTTNNQLMEKFKPIVKKAIQKVSVTKYWNPVVTTYNKVPMVQKQNPDLDKYVTDKALAGLFYLVAQEELKIRQNPQDRVSDILKKVFGRK